MVEFNRLRAFFSPRPLDAVGLPGYKMIGPRIATRAFANGRNGRIDNFGIGSCRAGGLTDIACTERAGNEDGLLLALRKFPGHEQLMISVADGIGGHGGGEVASALALNAIAKYFCECVPAAYSHTAAVTQAVVELAAWKAGHPELDKVAGTTLVSALANLRTGMVSLAHIGDARAYLLRGDDLFLLTRDDNYLGGYLGVFAGEDISPTFNALIKILGPDPEAAYDRLKVPFGAGMSQLLHDVNFDYYNNETFGGRICKAIGVGNQNGQPFQASLLELALKKGDILALMSDGVHDFIAFDPLRASMISSRRGTPLQIAEAIFSKLPVMGDNVTIAVYKQG